MEPEKKKKRITVALKQTWNVTKKTKKERRKEKWKAPVWDKSQRTKLKNCIELQSKIKIKPHFRNYSHFLFNTTNYLKCDSRILDFSELCS